MAWTKVTSEMLEMIPDRDVGGLPWKAIKSGAKYSVLSQDNFTVLLLRYEKDTYLGVAKRNPRDKYNPAIGIQVAFVRAYRAFAEARNG